jgi:hypothetical protein
MNNSACYGTKVRVRLPPRVLILKTIIMTKLEKLRKKVKLQNTWTNKRITFGTIAEAHCGHITIITSTTLTASGKV